MSLRTHQSLNRPFVGSIDVTTLPELSIPYPSYPDPACSLERPRIDQSPNGLNTLLNRHLCHAVMVLRQLLYLRLALCRLPIDIRVQPFEVVRHVDIRLASTTHRDDITHHAAVVTMEIDLNIFLSLCSLQLPAHSPS